MMMVRFVVCLSKAGQLSLFGPTKLTSVAGHQRVTHSGTIASVSPHQRHVKEATPPAPAPARDYQQVKDASVAAGWPSTDWTPAVGPVADDFAEDHRYNEAVANSGPGNWTPILDRYASRNQHPMLSQWLDKYAKDGEEARQLLDGRDMAPEAGLRTGTMPELDQIAERLGFEVVPSWWNDAGKKRAPELKVGDRVHIGFGAKGGAGYEGNITSFDGAGMAYVQTDEVSSLTGLKKVVKGPVANITPKAPATGGSRTDLEGTRTVVEDIKGRQPDARMQGMVDAAMARHAAQREQEQRIAAIQAVGPKPKKPAKPTEPVQISTPKFFGEADATGFRFGDLTDRNNEPRLIPPSKASKTAIKKMHAFMSDPDNLQRIQGMTMNQLMNEFTANGIRFHYYCAMD